MTVLRRKAKTEFRRRPNAHPPERLAFMLADAGAPVLLTRRRCASICRRMTPTSSASMPTGPASPGSPRPHPPPHRSAEVATCANAASVCRAFETSRRREVLSFGHHAEVAALDVKETERRRLFPSAVTCRRPSLAPLGSQQVANSRPLAKGNSRCSSSIRRMRERTRAHRRGSRAAPMLLRFIEHSKLPVGGKVLSFCRRHRAP